MGGRGLRKLSHCLAGQGARGTGDTVQQDTAGARPSRRDDSPRHLRKLGRFEQIGHRNTGDRRGRGNRRARDEGLGWEFVDVSPSFAWACASQPK